MESRKSSRKPAPTCPSKCLQVYSWNCCLAGMPRKFEETPADTSELHGAEFRLQALGIQLPPTPTPFGTYVETVETGNLLFFSGMLPVVDHKPKFGGRLGKELNVEDGRDAA